MSEVGLYSSGIRPYIDKLMAEKGKEIRDYGEYWSASSAGYCMRKVIFDRLHVPHTSEDARKQRIFESGHIFHSWIQGVTREAGISIAQETELIDDKLMIKGHIDDLLLIDGKLMLVDYKTQNSMAFSWAKKQNLGMSHYHKYQLGTYMYMLRSKKNRFDYAPEDIGTLLQNLTEARIVKISKDDLRMEEDQLLWNAGLEKTIYEYWSTLNGYWNAKTIPKCTCAEIEPNQKTGIGFMASDKYNPYYFQGEPCSLSWYKLFKEGKTDDYIKKAN